MSTNEQRYWIRAKGYGWGWGLPGTWQRRAREAVRLATASRSPSIEVAPASELR